MAHLFLSIVFLASTLLCQNALGGNGSIEASDRWGGGDPRKFLIVAEVLGHRRVPRRGNSPDALELRLRPRFTAAGQFDPTSVDEIAVAMYLADEPSVQRAEAEYATGTVVLALVNLYNEKYHFTTDRVMFMPGQRPIMRVKGPLSPEVLDVVERVRKERAAKPEGE